MHLLQLYGTSYDELINSALSREYVQPGEDFRMPLKAYWVDENDNVQIFDRIGDSHILNQNFFVIAEWAGEGGIPIYLREGHHYLKRFKNLSGYPDFPVTFMSSIYRLQPKTAVLSKVRAADSDGPDAISLKLIICDEDKRLGIGAKLSRPEEFLMERAENKIVVGEMVTV